MPANKLKGITSTSRDQIGVIWQRSARKALNGWPIIILDVTLLAVLSIALGASQVDNFVSPIDNSFLSVLYFTAPGLE